MPKMGPWPLQIAVIGAAVCDESVERLAHEVGREIARRGAILVCGGGSGVMAAAAAGTRAEGGLAVGILPGRDREESPPAPDLDVAIFTGIGQARNQAIVLSAAAVIGIAGGWGTLTEIGLALKHGIPVTLLESWALERPDRRPEPLMGRASTPAEAVEAALAAARAAGRADREASGER